jgi:hypothetical protein
MWDIILGAWKYNNDCFLKYFYLKRYQNNISTWKLGLSVKTSGPSEGHVAFSFQPIMHCRMTLW